MPRHAVPDGPAVATVAGLIGDPLVEIGHNDKVAWSHTVSTARRFVVRRLQLVPGDPTAYPHRATDRLARARVTTTWA